MSAGFRDIFQLVLRWWSKSARRIRTANTISMSVGSRDTSVTAPVTDSFFSPRFRSLRVSSIYNVDSRLTAGKSTAIFSTYDHATPAYVRNPACWAYGLDLTSISPWNAQGVSALAATLISPRHIVMCAHGPIVDDTAIRFVAADGTVVTRTVETVLEHPDYSPTPSHYPDIAIGVLDEDVPSTISYVKILPEDWRDYVTPYRVVNGAYEIWSAGGGEYSLWGIPCIFTDQEEKLLVADIRKLPIPPETAQAALSGTAPIESNRLLFNELIVAGDSGSPIFILVNGELVLLSVITTVGPVGTSIAYFKDDINTMMATLGGGYSLTEIDLSGFAEDGEATSPNNPVGGADDITATKKTRS